LLPAVLAVATAFDVLRGLFDRRRWSTGRKSRDRLLREPFGLRRVRRRAESSRLPHGRLRQHVCNVLYAAGNYYMGSGNLHTAQACFELLIRISDRYGVRGIRYHQALGTACFLLGDLPAAHAAFRESGFIHRVLLGQSRGSRKVRLLSGVWFLAFGHIAMLDFHFKQRRLGWAPNTPHVLMTHPLDNLPNRALLHCFSKFGIEFIADSGQFRSFYAKVKEEGALGWEQLSPEEQFAHTIDFWTYDFPDGKVLTYTHGAARIQQAWEAQGRPPLMRLNAEERAVARTLLVQMGVPEGAWFVCLHVREGGYHRDWNRKYPSARDAEIEDYYDAIRAITARGGWVVRMGDRTMTPLLPMKQVVDYAHSPFKCEIGDIVLSASARFLLGTNSGFATVPGIYGVPNVLTNWVPISLPLWFGADIMVPKLLWRRDEARHVSFEEMLSTPLGAMQNVADFPPDMEIRKNTPAEIVEATVEMLDRLDGRAYTAEDEQLQQRYFDLAIRCGSYRGSRIGREFLARHAHLLPSAARVAAFRTELAA
jgi:putative glycosyltransferase (TIGR04372 family)